jgi:CBS domain-containing protein
MSQDEPPQRPIVACRVEHGGGGGIFHLRVYCPRAAASVPLGKCEACATHIELPAGGEGGFVRCGPEGEAACRDLAVAPPIGALVTAPVRAVDESAPIAAAVELMVDAGAAPVLVVDASGQCVGALSRTRLLHRDPHAVLSGERPTGAARDAMTEAQVAVETTSVRDVLRTMAAHRLRYLAIVAEDGAPLGVVSDVEALRLFSSMRR